MSGGLGTATQNAILDLLFGGVAFTADATLYIGLYKVLPNADGSGGTECSAGNYARLAVTNNGTNFAAASGGVKTNAAKLEWPAAATADWADDAAKAVGCAVWTAASGGTLRGRTTFSPSKSILAGDVPFIPIGILSIQFI